MIHATIPVGSKHRVTARHPEVQQRYDDWRVHARQRHAEGTFCTFCNEMSMHAVVRELETAIVIENRFPYEYFDGQRVIQHYLLMTKRHLDRFSEFTDREYDDYKELLASYHNQGFSSMTRSIVDSHRSVPGHLHTHLLTYKEE